MKVNFLLEDPFLSHVLKVIFHEAGMFWISREELHSRMLF
jgi:hypothetical protein